MKFIALIIALIYLVGASQCVSSSLKVSAKLQAQRIEQMSMAGQGVVMNQPYIYENEQPNFQNNGMGKTHHRKFYNSFMELTEQMKTRTYLKADKDEDYPDEYYMDFCAEADEGKDIFFQCDAKKCPAGKVVSIPYAMYGATYGGCPNFFTTYQCVKEVNPFVNEECDDAPDCEFEVDADNFEDFKWTTNWGNWQHVLGCGGKKIKLQVVGSCKCSNNGGSGETEEEKQKRKEEAQKRKLEREAKRPCKDQQQITFKNDKGHNLQALKGGVWRVKMKADNEVPEAGKWTCLKRGSKKYAYKSAHNRYMRGLRNGWVDQAPAIGSWEIWKFNKIKDDHFKFVSHHNWCLYWGRRDFVLQTGNHNYKGCDWNIKRY